MELKIKFEGLDKLQDKLKRYARQIPYAASRGLNAIAKEMQQDEVKEMNRVFDRPTPWIQKGTYISPASKVKLEAELGLKGFASSGSGSAQEILKPHIFGGDRRMKTLEKALQTYGVMPQGMKAVPGMFAKLDMYGNMNRGQITQIRSYFKTFGEQGYSANITDKKRAKLKRGTKKKIGYSYFSIQDRHGRLHPGIYQKFHLAHGTAIKPVLMFVDSMTYQSRYDFYGVGQRTFNRVAVSKMQEAVDIAINTAR